jgi:hypothetical protein
MTREQQPVIEQKRRRPWSTPAIVSTQAAFEHGILTCNGAIGLTRPPRSPKGGCTSGGTVNS